MLRDFAPRLRAGRRSASERARTALRPGTVYRRKDLAHEWPAVDRHLKQFMDQGMLKKLAGGLYYAPRQSAFGEVPAEERALARAFLKEDDFLMFTPSLYNALGLGSTQLYNRTLVYNHKRHGVFKLGGRELDFRMKHRFPKKLTAEFLFVDMLNNLNELGEEREVLLARAPEKAATFDHRKLTQALTRYGSAATRKRAAEWPNVSAAA